MRQRRNPRSGVQDRWRKTIRDDAGNSVVVPSALDGKGLRWRAEYVDADGRPHTKAFARKTDAQQWLNEVTATVVTGTYVDPGAGRVTIGYMHSQWQAMQGHIKESTRAARNSAWSAHVEQRWADVELLDVQTSAVRAWVADMAADRPATDSTPARPGSSAATIENALGVLRMVCAVAVDDRRLARNPCDGVKAPRRKHVDRAYLTHQDVDELARTVSRDGLVIRFLAYTGLRYGEMAALRVQDFDMLRRRVNVRQAVTEVKGKLVWSTPKTHERRSVPFPRFLVEDLAARMEGLGRDDLVFQAPKGGVLRIATFRTRIMNPAVKALQGIDDEHPEPTTDWPRPTLHDLRHTAASLAISAGANVKAVQTMLGHKSAAMTLDTYADLFPDDLEAVADALDDARCAALA